MKNKNSDGKSKKSRVRFNFIDVLIILAILLLGAIVVNLFFPNFVLDYSKNAEKEIQYTVEFLCVDESLTDKIKENDIVVDSVSKYSVGTVMTVDRNTPYTELAYDKVNGTLLATFERAGSVAFVDLYEYAEVGQVEITASTNAEVYFYSVVE